MRRAKIEDIPAVYSFELAYMREIEPVGLERWMQSIPVHLRQWIANLPRMFIAVLGEEIVGHCFWEPDASVAVLASIFVVPPRRRHGYGQMLLSCFEQDAMAQGFTHLALGVFKDNPARRLYTQGGYQPTHTHGNYHHYAKTVL